MKRYAWFALVPTALVLMALSADRGEAQFQAPVSDVDRGKYLAHEVAMCVQCHSPRDRNGNLIQGRLFRGAPMPVKSPYPDTIPFAYQAPNIAGLTGYTDGEALRLLTTGVAKRGDRPQAPMPPYRMTDADAKAVIAYLRSL